jgi:hypothetical protein
VGRALHQALVTKGVDVIIDEPHVVLAHAGDLCVVIPRGEATPDLVAKIRRGIELLSKRRKDGIALLLIVTERSRVPSGGARAAVGRMFQELRPALRAVAALIAGGGFAAALKRSVFTWATSSILGKAPVKTFAALEEACPWLEAQCSKAGLSAPAMEELSVFVRQHDP